MPSYNYRCKDCTAECVYNLLPTQVLKRTDVYCEQCDSSRMELLEFSETEDLQTKKVVTEIHDLSARIADLITAVEDIRKRMETLEDFSGSDFSDIDVNLMN